MPQISYIGTHPNGMEFGGVFNSETAERFEGTNDDYDGYIMSEDLFLAEEGSWILNQVIGGNPDRSAYVWVKPETAHEWLKENHYPEAAKRYFESPKGGRPRIGERLITTAPARMYNQISALSEMYAEDVPDTVRRLLAEALAHRETIGAPGSQGADRPF